VLLIAIVLAALVTSGIDLTTLTVLGGALAVGVGLGLQKTVSNYVSGFVLIFEESVRPGDIINVGDTVGVVQALNARHVVVRTADGMDVLIPNEDLATQRITSWSYGDRNIRLRLPVQIPYGEDPERALALLEKIAAAENRVLSSPAPKAMMTNFGDNAIHLELAVWVDDPEHGLLELRSRLNREIWRRFDEHGIALGAAPQFITLTEQTGNDRVRARKASK
jgi:small-conductance mechanosensitive channel